MAYLDSQAGIEQVNVVYRSGAEMLTSLRRGDADTAIITVSTSLAASRTILMQQPQHRFRSSQQQTRSSPDVDRTAV